MNPKFIVLVASFLASSCWGKAINWSNDMEIRKYRECELLEWELDELSKTLDSSERKLAEAQKNLESANEALQQCEESKSADEFSVRPIGSVFRHPLNPEASLFIRGTLLKNDAAYDVEESGFRSSPDQSHQLADLARIWHAFYINIIDKRGNILFHFNPRFDKGYIAVNSYFGIWGHEERWKIVPFEDGVSFKMEIYNHQDGFGININGEFFNFFQHRSSNANIIGFRIGGDVEMHGVQVVENSHM